MTTSPADDRPPDGGPIVTKYGARSVPRTVERLIGLIAEKDLKLFAVIDQQAQAREVGLPLRETTLVLFGNPAAGTQVMTAVPLVALDLPLKVLIWADADRTAVSYLSPSALAARHDLPTPLAQAFAGLDAITDALVASGGSTS